MSTKTYTESLREPIWPNRLNLFSLQKPKIDFCSVLAKMDADWIRSERRFHNDGDLIYIGAGSNFTSANLHEDDVPTSTGDFLISTAEIEACV